MIYIALGLIAFGLITILLAAVSYRRKLVKKDK